MRFSSPLRPLLLSLFAASLWLGHALAQAPAPGAHFAAGLDDGLTGGATTDMRRIRDLEVEYLRAEMEGNAALAAPILADDYAGIRASGQALDKSDVLDNIVRVGRSQEAYQIAASGMREWIFGDTACLVYAKTYSIPGRTVSYQERVLHIFTKRNGVWRLQVSSPLPSNSPPGTNTTGVMP